MDTIKYFFHKDNAARMVILVYVELIVLTEILGAYWGAFWGLVSSSLLFLVILNHFVLTKDKVKYRSLLILALLPLIRLMSYAIPLRIFPPYLWHLILGIPVAISIILISRTPYFNLRDFYFDYFPVPYIILFGIFGIPLGIAGKYIQAAQDQGTGSNFFLIVISAAILFVFAALLEEIIFRGMLTDAFTHVFDRRVGLLVNILYASMFIGSQSIYLVLFMGLVGLIFSFFVNRTWSLWPSIFANWLFKVSYLLVGPIIIGFINSL